MITFQIEKWRPFYKEAHPLFYAHWQEIAVDQEAIKLSVDNERYEAMCDAGVLHILTARKDALLVGYYIAFVLPHVHYKEAGLMAFTDIYYMIPAYRKGIRGVQLFAHAENTLRDRGVTKVYLSTKVHKDNSKLFDALGWKLTDYSFTKVLERG